MAEILVVDDDQSVASAFERFLRNEGYAYRIASNAEDAVRMIDASSARISSSWISGCRAWTACRRCR